MLIARMVPVLYVLFNVLESGAQIRLTVKVHNSAHVSGYVLMKAEERSAGIFRRARITIDWDLVPPADSVRDPKQSEEWNPADLHLRLWTRAVVGTNIYGDDALGFRLSKTTAIILADDICRRTSLDFANPDDLLGIVMAHEIGHLLLPSPAHTYWGIMQAKLPTGLRDRRRMLLVFSQQQATLMQAEIHRRAYKRSEVLKCSNSSLAGSASADSGQATALDIQVNDYAALDRKAFDHYLSLVGEVLGKAGLSIHLSACPGATGGMCDRQPSDQAALVIKLLPARPKTIADVSQDALGLSVLNDAGASYGSIFLDSVRDQAAAAGVSWVMILAHEIGHLLLGAEAAPSLTSCALRPPGPSR
jgi:hypothetical protein